MLVKFIIMWNKNVQVYIFISCVIKYYSLAIYITHMSTHIHLLSLDNFYVIKGCAVK